MADFFFDFDTLLANSNLEDGLYGPLEDDDFREEEYDAFNNETFGSDAAIGDWEKDHEKLSEIAESSRSRPKNENASNKKNGVPADIEDNLSHLVLDEKEGIVPRPGVWDSPSNLSLPKPGPSVTLPLALTTARTVTELEKSIVGSRPPPGLAKPVQLLQQQQQQQQQPPQQQQQQQQKSDGSHLFESLSTSPRFPPGLGIPSAHPVILPPNARFPHMQFIPHLRQLPNQTGNVLRYQIPAHLMVPHAGHLMVPHGAQRQPIHGSFCNNFPQPPHSNLGPPSFMRTDHSMVPPFSSNQIGPHQQQHSFPYSGNQRNQNRSFHHPEQQGNHQPFFKTNQYHRNHEWNYQQRPYHYHHHNHTINGMTNTGEYDEYAGLMSSREKQWLINIQLLQLNTNESYVDDYYYTVFCDKKNKQNASQDQKDKKLHNNNNGYHRDSRDREQSQHHTLFKKNYIPAQFENSLGKLQFASVIAPRKVIDMDVVPNSDPQSATQIQQRDTRRTRQLLLEIERLYVVQLKLEDLHNPLALLGEQQQNQERENEANIVKKTKPELINTMLSSLHQLNQDDKLTSMLSIRKGKTLLLRFLPFVDVTEYRAQLEDLWNAIFRGLAIIGRRDSHLLITLYLEFQRWIAVVQDFGAILRLVRSLSDSVGHSVRNNSLSFALTNKFGVSVIASMLERAEDLYPTDDSSSEWSSFIANIIEITGESSPCVAPCQPVAANTLSQHLNRLSRVKTEGYANLELLLTDANPSR
nr:protein PAT1 homolog 1-like isoform X2 [Megalopta genalis]